MPECTPGLAHFGTPSSGAPSGRHIQAGQARVLRMLDEGLSQILDEVFRIFESDRNTDRSWFDSCRPQFRKGHIVMRSVNRQSDERLNSAQARCQQENSRAVAEPACRG